MGDDDLVDIWQVGLGEIDAALTIPCDGEVCRGHVPAPVGKRRQNVLELHGNENEKVAIGRFLDSLVDEFLVTFDDIVFETPVVAIVVDEEIRLVVDGQDQDSAPLGVLQRVENVVIL